MTQQATIAHSNALVVLLGAPTEVLSAVREAVAGSDPFGDVLAVLAARGVRHLPSLALVAADPEGLRVLVRGDITVEVQQSGGGRIRTDGRGISTWAETLHPDAVGAVVAHGDSETWFAVPRKPPTQESPGLAAHQVPAELAPDAAAVPMAETIIPPGADPSSYQEEEGGVAGGETPDFDLANLFETRYRGVEAAAVRVDEVEAVDETRNASPVEVPGPTGTGPSVDEAVPVLPLRGAGLIEGLPGFDAPADHQAHPDDPPGDHDGLTISAAELARLRSGISPAAGTSASPADPSFLQAVTCPSGHANPPRAEHCRACGQLIADRTIVVVKRPVLGRLRFDSGMVVDIDRPLLLGRKPTVRVSGDVAEVPSLVTLPDPDGSLSRLHAEVRLDGWEVMVVDRGSTNGTFVELPGRPATMLRPNEPLVVVPDTRISFADVISCRFEVGLP